MAFPSFKAFALTALTLVSSVGVQAYDVLELPAVRTELAKTSQLFGITKAGDRLVAVGIRGHILLSDDGGKSWRQAQSVPVRSDLLSVDFVDENKGWAVGHDSVILHTEDGGENWVKQFDGLKLGVDGIAYYQKKLEEVEAKIEVCEAADEDQQTDEEKIQCKYNNAKLENYDTLIYEMEFAAEQGADKPFFAVLCYYTMCNAGGAYGLNYRTADGGKNWTPVLENVRNPEFGHLFDAKPINDESVLVGGEMGSVWIAQIATHEWKYIKLNYEGSIFSVVSSKDGALLAGGLRGNLFRSTDNGEIWDTVEKPKTGSLVSSARLSDDRILFISQRGEAIISDNGGESFHSIPVPNPFGYVAMVESTPGNIVIVGNKGTTILDLNKQ